MLEVYLPSLPEFEIHKNIEFSLEKKKVYFALTLGCLDVVCTISSELKTEKFDVCPQGVSSEHCQECDFQFLEVGKTAVSVDQTDIEIMTGQKLVLTEKQIQELNEILKGEMVIV